MSSALRSYGRPKIVAFGFYMRQNMRQALIVGMIAALSAATSLIGFINAYPDEVSRQTFAASLAGNTGLKLLLGSSYDIGTVGGFVAWRVLGILLLIGSIWGLMLATRLFRGEEQAGRTELLLAGQTTLRRITVQLTGVAVLLSFVVLVLIFASTYGASIYKGTHLSVTSILFFALSLALSILMFMGIGAICGQFFATRAQALRISGIAFGVFFLLRGMGASVQDVHLLEDISPIGWVQNLQPFTGSHWQWFIPIAAVIVGCFSTAVWLAGKRDLGASIVADKDTARPKYRWLNSPLKLWVRLTRVSMIGWALGAVTISYIFGTLTKSAGDSFNDSPAARNVISKLTQSSDVMGEKMFYGMIFLIIMLLILVMVSGMIAAAREEEAEGYLDAILVRQTARLTVIKDKLLIIIVATVGITLLATWAAWFGGWTQHVSITITDLLPAAINTLAAALLLLGIGICTYGFKPRLTSIVVYSVIGWAFLVEMLGSVINLNHFILDTSLLHHVPLVPATDQNWQIVWVYCLLGIVLVTAGIIRFTKRDIETN